MAEYTPGMRRAVSQFKVPHGARLYVVQYPSKLALRVDKRTYDGVPLPKQIDIIEATYELKAIIESFGVDCDVEGFPDGLG